MQIPLLSLASAAVLSSSGHPNVMRLKGTLVRLDEPSTKPPHGSEGHRIMVPSDVARRRLKTLVGMGLNYAPDLKGHAQRRKVGVITRAWIEGKDLKVEATVWKKDFPEAERDLKQAGLGMSMEIGDVSVADPDARVWELSDFCFLGATVLERTSAAYFHTHAIAAARAKESDMKKTKTNGTKTPSAAVLGKELAEIAAAAATAAVKVALKPVMRAHAEILSRFDALDAAAVEVDDIDADEEEVDDDIDAGDEDAGKKKLAAKKDDAEDEDDDEADDDEDMESEIDKGGEEDMGPEADAGDDEPGHLNRGAKNKGRKSTSENTVGKSVAATRLAASLQREKGTRRELTATQDEVKKLKASVKNLRKQVEAAASQQSRRSVAVPGEIVSLLGKSGVDVKDLQASGEKLSVDQVDAVIAAMGDLPIQKRMEIKQTLLHHGLMDEGRVVRQ